MANRRLGPSLERAAVTGLWLVLALLFLGIGLQKLTPYEAAAIRPFAAHSPLLAWAYALAGVRGASLIFAAIEIPIGLGLAWGALRPGSAPARAAAAMAAVTSLVTASFLLTSPGVLVWRGGFPLLTLSVGQLFAKDLVLLVAALLLFGRSLQSRG